MGLNWGGFGNGLAQGLAVSDKLEQEINDARLARVRAQGIAEAKALQVKATPQITDLGDQQNLTANPQASMDPNAAAPVNTDIRQIGLQPQADASPDAMQTSPVAAPDVQDTSQLSDKPLASSAPGANVADPDAPSPFANGLSDTPRKRFNVDGQGFDTQEDAAAYVKKQTPRLESFFKDTLIPKMTAALVAQGKPDQAQAWEKYADEEQTRTNMATWAKAVKLAQFGDHAGAAEELMKLHPHFDDGYDLVNSEPTKGPNGQDGFTLTVKGPDGKEQQMYQDAQTITELGLAQLSPIEMFNKRYQRQAQADMMAAREAVDQRNDQRTYQRMMDVTTQRGKDMQAKQDAADKARQARQDAEDKAKAERDAQRAADKENQIRLQADEQTKRDAARIAAGGQYRKAVSPEERQAIIVGHLSQSIGWNRLTPEQQKAKVDQTMALIPQAKQPAAQPSSAAPAANPQQQGLPSAPASAAPAGKRAVPVFNPATGKVETVYR